MKNIISLILFVIWFFPVVAYAHEDNFSGFLSGLIHPIFGFDHLVAMLSVGILSIQFGGRAIWLFPAVFVLIMLFGGLAGIWGIPLFFIELGIALSVMMLGFSIVLEKNISQSIIVVFVGFFAMFHGYAHGVEMPYLNEPAFYVFGFIIGSVFIHIMGILIAHIFQCFKCGRMLLRCLGAFIAGLGIYLVF
ncbi:MAG: HupE/UreJ family protein [Cellvibrionaceae bacterium]